MQPVLTNLIAPYLLAERNHLYRWLGVLVGFVGVAVFVWGYAKFSGIPLVIYLLPLIATISPTTITIIERRGLHEAGAADYDIIILAAFCNANLPCPTGLLGRRVCG